MKARVTRLKNSVRLVQHGCVLSETPVRPGPTHSVFDVLAAAVVAFAPPGPVAMLGFAGGGMVAPLRKAGFGHEVRAVDLCARGHTLFRSVSRGWGGALTFEKEDALHWLRRQRGRFGAIVEDLSVPREGDVVKPEVSWRQLPPLIGRKLRADGVAVANLLPTPGVTWGQLLDAVRLDGLPAVVVGLERFQNRIVVQSGAVRDARGAGARLRECLRTIGSRMAEEISVRTAAP